MGSGKKGKNSRIRKEKEIFDWKNCIFKSIMFIVSVFTILFIWSQVQALAKPQASAYLG